MQYILICLIPFAGVVFALIIWAVLSVDRTDNDYKDGKSNYH